MNLIILFWHCEKWDGQSFIFGKIKFVKGDCTTNYESCSPDPTCYPFIAPTSKCLELSSGVSSTYFAATNTYLSDTYDYYITPLPLGYVSLVCSIGS